MLLKHPLFRRFFRRLKRFLFKKETLIGGVSAFLLILGAFSLWAASLRLPDVSSFNTRVISQSTKFYDRTGEILLFNTYENFRRTSVPLTDVSRNLRNASVAIEDAEFYEHIGIKPTAILRAVLSNALITFHLSSGYTQGGSTITQQVVKNSLLTTDKKISRKIKEWVLALKLEKVLTKDQILEIYLNDAPYGGNVYGAEEASLLFFGIPAKSLTMGQAAYLAALPQAPSYYSPYGNHVDKLEARKNLVLSEMLRRGFITQSEYDAAKTEVVEFRPPVRSSVIAPHFVFYLKDYLIEKYGIKALDEKGLKVTTSIDATLQQKAQDIVNKYTLSNAKKFDAENAGLVAIDPKTGQILVMVGSRDYFDKGIDGNFNVTLAKRQPGSSFKPFVYATAFKEGYTPETVVWDAKTQFSTSCAPENFSKASPCFSPDNYDNKFRGPVTLRSAIAESLNVPSVKVLYLTGINDALQTARDLGITTLTNSDRYGLTLVLGGGEVTLLEMTSAYGVFANDGVRNPSTGILKIEDGEGIILEEFEQRDSSVISNDVARTVSDVLSDNEARSPTFGERSALHFPGRDVAAKTGTTNDYRDAWVLGYTPSFVAGAWAGNNDNRVMQRKVAGLIVAPMWNEFMNYALQTVPNENFKQATPLDETTLPPPLRGIWQGGDGSIIDKRTGLPATLETPAEFREERLAPSVHSILYWINKTNPLGPRPQTPDGDPQFAYWEFGIKKWIEQNGLPTNKILSGVYTNTTVTTFGAVNDVSLSGVLNNASYPLSGVISFSVLQSSSFQISHVEVFLNDTLVGTRLASPFTFSFTLRERQSILKNKNLLKVVAYDFSNNKKELLVSFAVDLSR